MKKIILFIFSIFSIGLISCEKELTNNPIGLTTLEEVSSEPNLVTVENSVNSSYQLLSNTLNILGSWNWSAGLVINNDLIMQDLASDDMEKKWNPDGDQVWMDEINNFTFTSTNSGVNGLWKYNYEGIKRLNLAIDLLTNPQIEVITGITTARKNQLLGEAYFLRSFYYFTLVNNYGGVPLILKPIKIYQEAFELAKRATLDEVWANIKGDLAKAKALLPNSKYSSNTEKWRVSKGAVIALEAKAALYTKKWDDVLTYVNELQTLNYYSLNANYFDSFDQNKEFTDNEVIFAYDHVANVKPQKSNGICALLGWGFFAPSQSFLNEFEAGDPRKLFSVNTAEDMKNMNKLLGTLNGGNKGSEESGNNKIYIRFADVLLWKAEALLEKNNLDAAVDQINLVRARARTTPTADASIIPTGTLLDRAYTTDQTVVKNWLIHERRVELGFESHRMLDLKRWGLAKAVIGATGKLFMDKHYIYPIPQQEVDASAGLLTQDPNY